MMDSVSMDTALLVLRIVIGGTLLAHALVKFKIIDMVAKTFSAQGLRPGGFHARLAALTELAAGLGIAFGFLTPLAGLAYVGVMFTAGWVAHRKNGFFILRDGWEFVFILGVGAAFIAWFGPGRYSLDWAFDNDASTWFWANGGWWELVIAVGGGVLMSVLTLATFYRPSQAEGATAGGSDSGAESGGADSGGGAGDMPQSEG